MRPVTPESAPAFPGCRFNLGYATARRGYTIRLEALDDLLPAVLLFGSDQRNRYRHFAKAAGGVDGRPVVRQLRNSWAVGIRAVLKQEAYSTGSRVRPGTLVWLLEVDGFKEHFGRRKILVFTRSCVEQRDEARLLFTCSQCVESAVKRSIPPCGRPDPPSELTLRSIQVWRAPHHLGQHLVHYSTFETEVELRRFVRGDDDDLVGDRFAVETDWSPWWRQDTEHVANVMVTIRVEGELWKQRVELQRPRQQDSFAEDPEGFLATHDVLFTRVDPDRGVVAEFVPA
jgi:hypothetical protein